MALVLGANFEFDMALNNKRYTPFDHFHGNAVYGKIPTKEEPIRMF